MKSFVTLLKREYWENRGGFLWAPYAVAAFIGLMMIIGVFIAHGWFGEFKGHVKVGIELGHFMNAVPDSALPNVARGFDMGLLGFAAIIQVIMTIVVFFYCVGTLYDERRDRSILFWKSLPVSDVATVTAKVLAAALLAPLLAWTATIALHLIVLGIVSVVTMVHGGDVGRLVIGPAEPLALWLKLLAKVPIYALWMLPMYGWLMLASSFARSKAFLWAIVPPILFGLAWTMFEMSRAFQLPSTWVWGHVVSRVLPFLVFDNDAPTAGMVSTLGMNISKQGPALAWSDLGSVLANPETWIGAAAGIAMLALAVHFRRKRELAD